MKEITSSTALDCFYTVTGQNGIG